MYVPRVRSGFVIPRWLLTALAVLCAILTALLVASLFTRSTTDDAAFSSEAASLATSPGFVVYSVTEGRRDVIYVRDVEGMEPARRVDSFEVPLGQNHVRGATSPAGDRIAVLHLEAGAAEASLAIIDLSALASNDERTFRVEDRFNYLSPIAWSRDGSHLALTRRIPGPEGAAGFELLEVDALNSEISTIHTFPEAFEVAPVGYAPDGRLLTVVVDKAGSSLWAHGDGQSLLLITFSSGLSRDWSLSPGGDRLAFVEHLGAGERSRVGRVLMIATGRVTDVLDSGDQLGVVWQPGSPVPDFGGPDGTVALSATNEGAYLVPLAWTPDMRYLITTVVEPGRDGRAPTESVQIVSPDGRVLLAEGQSVRFLGLLPGE